MPDPDTLAEGRAAEAAGDFDAAVELYRRAIVADPDDPAGYVHLGATLHAAAFLTEARGVLDIGLGRLPGSPLLRWTRCMATLPMVAADADDHAAATAEFLERLAGLRAVCFANTDAAREAERAVGLMSPFFLAYQGGTHLEPMRLLGELAADIMRSNHPARATAPVVPRRSGEKIRVGIVCGLFRRHAVWRMPTKGWVENIDRDRFEMLGYHTRDERDDETERAAAAFDRFQSGYAAMPAWFARIAHDRPHVLIFPELGMDQTAFKLAAARLAPVRCASWGHPVSSGLPTIEHYLSSDLMEPPDAQAHYTENLVRLDGLGTVFQPGDATWNEKVPTDDPWAGFGLPDDAIRVLCCQSTSKYLPAHDDIFPRIARAMPRARFVFVNHAQRNTDLLWRRLFLAFQARGLSAEAHCAFVPGMPHAAFSALLRGAHVYLDTVEWGGCNTTLDAIRHGVPVATLPGATMRSRHGVAMLTQAGATETVAGSVEELVAMVVRLGSDTDFRGAAAARLARGRSRLFGDTAPVRSLEAFLEDAVARACPVAA